MIGLVKLPSWESLLSKFFDFDNIMNFKRLKIKVNALESNSLF